MSQPLSRRIDAVLDLDPSARAIEFDGRWHTFAEVATLARRVPAERRYCAISPSA